MQSILAETQNKKVLVCEDIKTLNHSNIDLEQCQTKLSYMSYHFVHLRMKKLEIVNGISEMIIIGHNNYQIDFHFKLFIRITRNIEMMKCV